MNKLVSPRLSIALSLLFLSWAPIATAQSPSANSTQPSLTQQIWSCRAENGTRIYVVDQLKRDEESFDMAVYEQTAADYEEADKYIETVQVNVSQTESELIGSGETSDSTVTVSAFVRTVAFNVQDSIAGSASGRCDVQWQMADRETRRLVRQCLALAASGGSNVASVERFACTGDPESYIEELQQR